MPVIRFDIVDGPHEEASGRIRGGVEVEFDTRPGRPIFKSLDEPDLAAWSNKLTRVQAEVEAQVREEDADVDETDDDEELDNTGEADRWDRACSTIRRGNETRSLFRAHKLYFKVWDTLATQQGLTTAQVKNRLQNQQNRIAPLTNDEYDLARTAWLELRKSGAQNTITAYKALQDSEWWGKDDRQSNGG